MTVALDILHGLVLLLAIILTAVLIAYEKDIRSNSIQNSGATMRGPGKKTSQIIGKWLRVLCIISAALCACTCLNDLVYYNVEMQSNAQCTAPRNLGVALLTTLDLSIYLFLWLRQYLVYKNFHFERRIVRNVINIFKWGTLSFIIGSFLIANSLLACCRRYCYNITTDECWETTPEAVDKTITYVWSVGSIILHSTLVLMFAFPLTKLAHQRITGNSDTRTASQNRLLALVHRCLAMSFACVFTDILVMLLSSLVFTSSDQSQLRHLLYNINVLLNCTFIVASFKEWKQMLFPCAKISLQDHMNTVLCSTTTEIGKDHAVGPT